MDMYVMAKIKNFVQLVNIVMVIVLMVQHLFRVQPEHGQTSVVSRLLLNVTIVPKDSFVQIKIYLILFSLTLPLVRKNSTVLEALMLVLSARSVSHVQRGLQYRWNVLRITIKMHLMAPLSVNNVKKVGIVRMALKKIMAKPLSADQKRSHVLMVTTVLLSLTLPLEAGLLVQLVRSVVLME